MHIIVSLKVVQAFIQSILRVMWTESYRSCFPFYKEQRDIRWKNGKRGVDIGSTFSIFWIFKTQRRECYYELSLPRTFLVGEGSRFNRSLKHEPHLPMAQSALLVSKKNKDSYSWALVIVGRNISLKKYKKSSKGKK